MEINVWHVERIGIGARELEAVVPGVMTTGELTLAIGNPIEAPGIPAGRLVFPARWMSGRFGGDAKLEFLPDRSAGGELEIGLQVSGLPARFVWGRPRLEKNARILSAQLVELIQVGRLETRRRQRRSERVFEVPVTST